MLIKGFSIFISCGHFDEGMGAILAISVEGHPRNIFVKFNFGRGSPKEHFRKIILKYGLWSGRRCHLKFFFLFLQKHES